MYRVHRSSLLRRDENGLLMPSLVASTLIDSYFAAVYLRTRGEKVDENHVVSEQLVCHSLYSKLYLVSGYRSPLSLTTLTTASLSRSFPVVHHTSHLYPAFISTFAPLYGARAN